MKVLFGINAGDLPVSDSGEGTLHYPIIRMISFLYANLRFRICTMTRV